MSSITQLHNSTPTQACSSKRSPAHMAFETFSSLTGKSIVYYWKRGPHTKKIFFKAAVPQHGTVRIPQHADISSGVDRVLAS